MAASLILRNSHVPLSHLRGNSPLLTTTSRDVSPSLVFQDSSTSRLPHRKSCVAMTTAAVYVRPPSMRGPWEEFIFCACAVHVAGQTLQIRGGEMGGGRMEEAVWVVTSEARLDCQ